MDAPACGKRPTPPWAACAISCNRTTRPRFLSRSSPFCSDFISSAKTPIFCLHFNNILSLATALGFIALGQTIVLLLGAIDLSVGPLAGFLVVVASFFINDDKSGLTIAAGFALVFLGAV